MTQSGSPALRSFFSDNFSQGSNPDGISHDRLGFSFCLALALHCAVILGVSFNIEDRSLAPSKLEITLAQFRSDKAPEKADFLAQTNQEGSGTLEEKAMLTTTNQADFQDVQINDVAPQQQIRSSQPQTEATAKISTIKPQQQQTTNRQLQERIMQTATQQAGDLTIFERSIKIASLEAKLDIQRQAYAKRPRIRRLTSVATKQSDDALYLHNWRTKIEAIGNQHYPIKARQQGLHGDLRLVVSLLPSGDIKQVKILQSSGYKILDQAAIRIVHLAAPYDPFPSSMGSKVDILEIIRTWRFYKGTLTSTNT